MLRHPTLIPLSHQHQHALALCVRIERGLRAGASREKTAELTRRAGDLFELELRNHFDVEERILFPAIREHLGAVPLLDELIAEHRHLEALIARAPETLAEFGSTLSAHIRKEERDLFEDIQKRLTPETLAQLGKRIEAEVVRVCL